MPELTDEILAAWLRPASVTLEPDELRDVWWLLYPDVLAVQVIAPPDQHVNLREVAHAWGCLTATPLPDFTSGLGTI